MSTISHKKPGFGPLNTRKTDRTVGQTYGERRERTKTAESEHSLNWVQWAKDKFLGGKKYNNIDNFADKGDRFLKTQSANPIVDRKNRIESGEKGSSKATPQANDHYVRFLDSIITYLDKKPKKV